MNVGVAVIDLQLERSTLFCVICCSEQTFFLPLLSLDFRPLVGGDPGTASLACVCISRRSGRGCLRALYSQSHAASAALPAQRPRVTVTGGAGAAIFQRVLNLLWCLFVFGIKGRIVAPTGSTFDFLAFDQASPYDSDEFGPLKISRCPETTFGGEGGGDLTGEKREWGSLLRVAGQVQFRETRPTDTSSRRLCEN